MTMLNLHAVMCVPLQSHNRLIGVIQACSLNSDNNFDMYDLKLLTAIGMQAGTGIENAMLYEELVSEKSALLKANERLRVAQENLVQSEKLAAVGQLAAGIAHDVKNPIVIIKGQAQLLQETIKGSGLEDINGVDVYQCLKEIEQGGAALRRDRQPDAPVRPPVPPPPKQLVEVKTVLEAVLSFLSHEFHKRRVSLKTRLADLKTEVMLDENQVKQTFINIVLNALQAMEQDGGVLEVSTGRRRRGRQKLRPGELQGFRLRHGRGGAPEHFRPLLHDQESWRWRRRQRAGALGELRHHPEPWRPRSR